MSTLCCRRDGRPAKFRVFGYRVEALFPSADDLRLAMRSLVPMGFSCALLVVASCVAAPQQQTIRMKWTSPGKGVVLVQLAFDLKEDGQRRSDWNEAARIRALTYLKVRSAAAGFTLIVANPSV